MKKVLKEKLKKRLQKIFWIYPCNIFIIKGMNEFQMLDPKIKCDFVPITLDNCHRVKDFREESRILQYKDKLAHNEMGYFAEHNGKIVGSIWATVNKTQVPNLVRRFVKLMPNEGLIHDIVTGENSRRMGVGTIMVSRIVPILLKEWKLNRILIDVNIKNWASLKMMGKLHLQKDQKVLYVSAFGKVWRLVLRKYS